MPSVCKFVVAPINKLKQHMGNVFLKDMVFMHMSYLDGEAFKLSMQAVIRALPQGSTLFVHAPADPDDATVYTEEDGSFEVISEKHQVSNHYVCRCI
jgi:hypothetical protein